MAKDNKDGGEVVESTIDISEIPGEEKAAILLLSLNEEDAAGIIRHLEPKQVQRVGSAMARAKDLSQTKVSAVHRAFWKIFKNTPTLVWAVKTSYVMLWLRRWGRIKPTTWWIKFCLVPARKVWIH